MHWNVRVHVMHCPLPYNMQLSRSPRYIGDIYINCSTILNTSSQQINERICYHSLYDIKFILKTYGMVGLKWDICAIVKWAKTVYVADNLIWWSNLNSACHSRVEISAVEVADYKLPSGYAILVRAISYCEVNRGLLHNKKCLFAQLWP